MNIKFAPKKALLITLVSLVGLATSTLTASAALNINPSSVTVSSGQSSSASISGGDGSYYASSNTNPSAVQLSINGSGIIFTTTNSTTGASATITICDAINPSSCGTIVATVGTSSSNNNSPNNNSTTTNTNPLGPTLGQSSVTMARNTSQSISIGGNGNYFISSNTGGNVVSASINGSSLVLASNESGNSTVTVCHSGGCNNVSVTVTGSSNSGGITFNQSNPSIAPGGVLNINISGGTGIYNLSNNSNPTALIATLSGNTVRATGVTVGTSILNVCDSSNACGSVTVTITGTGSITNTVTPVTTNTNTGNSNIPQGYARTLLSQIQAMEAQLAQFSSQLASLRISLNTLIAGNFPTASTAVNTPVTTSNSSYVFFSSLDAGASGPEVTALQNRLSAEGYYSGPITGYYGSLTVAAVKKFQAANGIAAQGNVGPSTRAALNNQ